MKIKIWKIINHANIHQNKACAVILIDKIEVKIESVTRTKRDNDKIVNH